MMDRMGGWGLIFLSRKEAMAEMTFNDTSIWEGSQWPLFMTGMAVFCPFIDTKALGCNAFEIE